jgi:hypothetical protein
VSHQHLACVMIWRMKFYRSQGTLNSFSHSCIQAKVKHDILLSLFVRKDIFQFSFRRINCVKMWTTEIKNIWAILSQPPCNKQNYSSCVWPM